MKRSLALSLLGLALLNCLPALSKPALLSGSVAQYNEIKVANEIPWTTSLQNAELKARREGKMVFWIHMLGDIKGAT